MSGTSSLLLHIDGPQYQMLDLSNSLHFENATQYGVEGKMYHS